MLIDDVQIKVVAGNGGRGCVAFNKNMLSLGPAGGSGGKGGSVWAEGVSNLSALSQFRYKKILQAENGRDGRDQFKDGHDGQDLLLKVPVGTAITNLETGRPLEITKVGERKLLAKGGWGGKGNFQFKSSTNTSPKQSEPGRPGEEFQLRLELKLIADIGLIGLPNAGKSSLLNELTEAKSKTANYPFTTLEPNLGVYYGLIIADIPGLIEGSSTGKGLGIKFLRHIERTKILFHLISADSGNPKKDYQAIRKELGLYNKNLLEKPEYVFLSKSDNVTPAEARKKLAVLKKISKSATAISILDNDSLLPLKKILNKIEAEKGDGGQG